MPRNEHEDGKESLLENLFSAALLGTGLFSLDEIKTIIDILYSQNPV